MKVGDTSAAHGEQIHTASTSGWLITFIASLVYSGSLNCSAAFFALDSVGLEIMMGSGSP